MQIRKAQLEDLNNIRKVYDAAKQYMDNTGNPNQWKKGHPPREVLEEDIALERLYVCVEDGKTCGVFMFAIMDDVTYHVIEDGAWKNDELYGVIHRIASDGTVKGVFTAALNYAKEQVKKAGLQNLRIDTHHDNKTMQHVVTKHGFERCGIIYLENGSPRIAYHLVLR